MTEPTRPTFLRRKLGAKLRRMREQAGMTLDTAAPRLDRKKSALHRVEVGETKADVHLVKSMMDLYNIYDKEILDQAREAAKPPWYQAFGFKAAPYIDVETQAMRLRQFLLIDIPGLLQTEAYMRALFGADPRVTDKEADRAVIVRHLRQQRLTDQERPLELVSIVYEAALRNIVGGPQVMYQQLLYLVEAAKLAKVTLRVMPLEGRGTSLPPANFSLLEFPEPADPDMMYVEHASGSLLIENIEVVKNARVVFDQLRTAALSSADSLALIERLARDLYGA